MAKGIVRSVSTSMGSSTGIGITVSSTGATGSTSQGSTSPPGQVLQGTLQDATSGTTYPFSLPFGAELGIALGSKLDYNTVTIGGVVTVNEARLTHRGEIVSVNAQDSGGMLLDKGNGQQIPFAQTSSSLSGIVQGAKVNFELIVDPNSGQITAVALIVVTD